MLQDFEIAGRDFLKTRISQKMVENEILVGFHCPPFNSQHHLHLHIVYPKSKLNRAQLGKVKNPGWFPIEKLIHSLEEYPEPTDRFPILTGAKKPSSKNTKDEDK